MSSKTKKIALDMAAYSLAFCTGCAIASQEKEISLRKVDWVVNVIGDIGQTIGLGVGIAVFFEGLKRWI